MIMMSHGSGEGMGEGGGVRYLCKTSHGTKYLFFIFILFLQLYYYRVDILKFILFCIYTLLYSYYFIFIQFSKYTSFLVNQTQIIVSPYFNVLQMHCTVAYGIIYCI